MSTTTGTVLSPPDNLNFDRFCLARNTFLQPTSISALVSGLDEGQIMLEATQNTAKHISTVIRDAATGLGASLTSSLLASLVILLKKGNQTTYSTISPTLTAVGVSGLIDLSLTGSHLDTIGVSAINITGPGVLPNNTLFIDVISINKNDSVRGGMSSLPNSAIGTQAGLSTKQNLDDVTTTINSHTDTAIIEVNTHTDTATSLVNSHIDATIASLPSPTDILDSLLSDHSSIGSVADGIAITAGLLQGNFFMDTVVNDGNGQTSARLRLWRDEAGAAGANGGGSGEGEFATFQVTTTYSGPGKVATHRVVRVVGT